MNYKKILIMLILFVAVAGLTMSTVNAITPEQKTEAEKLLEKSGTDFLSDGGVVISSKDVSFPSGSIKTNYAIDGVVTPSTDEYIQGNVNKIIRVQISEKFTSGGEPVKKDDKYQRKYNVITKVRIFDVFFEKVSDNKYDYIDFNINKTNQKVVGYKYTPMKKGEWFDIYKSSTKTEHKKGKISKVTYDTGLQVVNSKKVKKVTAVTKKKVIGYYKTFKMPIFAPGKSNWGSFKGNSFTYGNSYIGYYVNHLKESDYYNYNHRVYKVSPSTYDLLGTHMFYKKPSSFTLYAYA